MGIKGVKVLVISNGGDHNVLIDSLRVRRHRHRTVPEPPLVEAMRGHWREGEERTQITGHAADVASCVEEVTGRELWTESDHLDAGDMGVDLGD